MLVSKAFHNIRLKSKEKPCFGLITKELNGVPKYK